MNTTIPAFSPGCFGSALAFQADHSVCMGCVFADQCAPMSKMNLIELRRNLGVDTEVKEVVAKEPVYTVTGELALPKKTQDLVDKLDKLNLQVVENLQRGSNPFVGLLPYMRIAAHVLIHRSQPLSRDFLALCFVKKLSWQENTAQAHARMAIQALKHIGAVDELDGQFTIRKVA